MNESGSGASAGPIAAPESGGWTLEHFRPDMAKSYEERKRLHGDMFLALLGGALRRPALPKSTDAVVAVETMEARGAATGTLIAEVWPIVRSGRSYFPHVSVGRTPNNDIVIPDTSVSKFHAFFKRDGERLFLSDAGSRNGTLVNDVPVPPQTKGKPVELKGSARVTFGSVELVFLQATQLWSILDTVYGKL